MRTFALLTLIFLTGCSMFALPTVPPNALVTPTQQAQPSPTASPRPTVTAADVATIRATVYVRSAPDANSAEVGSLETGESVEVVGCDGSWCEIRTDVLSGYVFRGCLSDNPDGLKCEVRE